MARIERFEDIEAWRKARELTKLVYEITQGGAFARDYGLRDQIRRAAVSIMSNIAEGFEPGGNAEFRQSLALAKGAAGEIRAQVYVAFDAGFLSQSQFEHLYRLRQDVSRLIGGLMRYSASQERGYTSWYGQNIEPRLPGARGSCARWRDAHDGRAEDVLHPPEHARRRRGGTHRAPA